MRGGVVAIGLVVVSLALAATASAVFVRRVLSDASVVDGVTMVTVAEARPFVGRLERLDDADDGFVVGGCSELIVDAAVAAQRRRVVELSVHVAPPRLTTEVAAVGQLERAAEGRRSVRTTDVSLSGRAARLGPSLRHCLLGGLRRLTDVIT